MKTFIWAGFAVTIALVTTVTSQLPKSLKPSTVDGTTCSRDYSTVFVREGKEPSEFSDEGVGRIWIRFTNDLNQPVFLEAAQGRNTSAFLTSGGKAIDVYYELVEKENCRAKESSVADLPIGYTRREVSYELKIKPGNSVLFSVAKGHITANRAVYISYWVQSDRKAREKGEARKAYFFSGQIPKGKKLVD